MTTQPDPNRHEASRPAFEAGLRKALDRVFTLGGNYACQSESDSYSQNRKAGETKEKYLAVVEAIINDALDHAAAQVCGWTPQGQDGENGYRAECGQWWHWHFKMTSKCCPACGRRVKIINNETTTTPNQ